MVWSFATTAVSPESARTTKTVNSTASTKFGKASGRLNKALRTHLRLGRMDPNLGNGKPPVVYSKHSAPNVPIDFYGYTPHTQEEYNTWTGFMFTIFVMLFFGFASAYGLFQFLTLPYNLSETPVSFSSRWEMHPRSKPSMPDIGVDFRLANGSALHDPSVLRFTFVQSIMERDANGEGDTVSFPIPSEECSFWHTDDLVATTNAHCYKPVIQVDDAPYYELPTQETAGRENLPIIKGLPRSNSFYFMDILVSWDSDRVASDDALRDAINGGIATVYTKYSLRNINDAKVLLGVKTHKWLRSRAYAIKENGKVDVKLTLRQTTVKTVSPIMDLEFLAKYYRFVVLQDTYWDWAYRKTADDNLLNIRVCMDAEAANIDMAPFTTVFDFLGMIGGVYALLQQFIGIPVGMLTRSIFQKELRQAVKKGYIEERYLMPNGHVRSDYAGQVVAILQRKHKHDIGKRMYRIRKNIIKRVTPRAYRQRKKAIATTAGTTWMAKAGLRDAQKRSQHINFSMIRRVAKKAEEEEESQAEVQVDASSSSSGDSFGVDFPEFEDSPSLLPDARSRDDFSGPRARAHLLDRARGATQGAFSGAPLPYSADQAIAEIQRSRPYSYGLGAAAYTAGGIPMPARAAVPHAQNATSGDLRDMLVMDIRNGYYPIRYG